MFRKHPTLITKKNPSSHQTQIVSKRQTHGTMTYANCPILMYNALLWSFELEKVSDVVVVVVACSSYHIISLYTLLYRCAVWVVGKVKSGPSDQGFSNDFRGKVRLLAFYGWRCMGMQN